MPKGLKETSALITISADIVESGANTFTQEQVDLQLNPLDNEVFVVQAIDIQSSSPDMVTGTNTSVTCGVSTTSRTTVGSLADSNCLARLTKSIRSDAVNAVAIVENSADTPASQLEYIGIIATNDFFLQVLGGGNTGAKNFQCRMYGYRAKADAAVYAALVQSEVLSS